MTDDQYLQDVRGRMWEAAASENDSTYRINDDQLVVHDPAVMAEGTAIVLDMRDIRYVPMRW